MTECNGFQHTGITQTILAPYLRIFLLTSSRGLGGRSPPFGVRHSRAAFSLASLKRHRSAALQKGGSPLKPPGIVPTVSVKKKIRK